MRISSGYGAVLSLLVVSACALEPSKGDGAEGAEDALSSGPLASFGADLKPAEMSAAKALQAGSLGASTLFRYSSGGGHHLQLLGAANASGGSIAWFLYDAKGHLLASESNQGFSGNPHFFLQPYIAHAGSYFLRIATGDQRLLPLDLRSTGRVTTEVTPLGVPVEACEALPTHAELERLMQNQPPATVADVAAVGLSTQRIAGGERWVKLGGFRIQRFEREDSDGCLVFGDGCGAWSETAPPELPEGLRSGALFLARQASTRSELLFLGSRLVTGSLDLRLKGGMGASYTERTPEPIEAKLGPLGFLTPGGRAPQQVTVFTVTDAAEFRAPSRSLGAWDGILGKDCVRLYTTSTARTPAGALRRTVMTLGATFGDRPPPLQGEVVINEVMPEGASATDEFVELYNPGSVPIALEGHVLSSVSGGGARTACFTGRPADVIPPNGFFVLGGAGFAGARAGDLGCSIAGSGGRLVLADVHGRTRDGLGWGTAEGSAPTEGYYRARAAPKRKAISRRSDGADTNVNASDFGVTSPTPGAPNVPLP